MSKSLLDILTILPEFAYSPDVKQTALMALGINNPAEVLDALAKEAKANPEVALTKALRGFRESLQKSVLKGADK